MRVVKGVAIGPAGCANAEAMLVEMLHHGRVRQRMVALERQQVVGTVQRLGVYAASAQRSLEPGVGSNSWPKPQPNAPL